jgi:hypothetical protein
MYEGGMQLNLKEDWMYEGGMQLNLKELSMENLKTPRR